MEEMAALLKQKTLEVEELRLKNSVLEAKLKQVTMTSETSQQAAEAQEEAVTLRLFSRLAKLRRDRDELALKIEQEEEFMTNSLQRKLDKVTKERDLAIAETAQLEKLKASREKIKRELDRLKLEKHTILLQLEQEEDCITNKFLQEVAKLKRENRKLQLKLDQTSGTGGTDDELTPRISRNDASIFRTVSRG